MSRTSSQSKRSYLSEAHREKLLKLKEREDLKGQLINKFIAKYGNSRKPEFIEKEVSNALQLHPLTEENLRKLEEKIQKGSSSKASASRPISQASKSIISGVSVRTGQSQVPVSERSRKSQSEVSYMSGASKLSETTANEGYQSSVASQSSKVSSVALPSNKDEWAVILEYKQAIYRDEEQRRLERERQQKLAIKKELDKQIQEKKLREQQEKEETDEYIKAQERNVEEQEKLEHEKLKKHKELVMQEKALRDQQYKQLRRMRRQKEKEERNIDVAMVQRLQQEHQQEVQALKEKKINEIMLRRRMLEENQEIKHQQQLKEQQERQEQIELQKNYERMLDKMEQDRLNEIKKREARAQNFLNQAAGSVLKQQNLADQEEQERVLRQMRETAQFDEAEHERLREKDQLQKEEIRKALEQQMQEKQVKKQKEKEFEKVQARAWQKQAEDEEQLEYNAKQRRDQVYKEYARQLNDQIQEKKHVAQTRMDNIERALNKDLIKEVIKNTADIPEVKKGKQ